MAIHELRPERANLHGNFHAAMPPILTVVSGDRIVASTLDARWHRMEQADLDRAPIKVENPEAGHALLGPILIQDAEPGDALEIRFEVVEPGTWGWTVGGGWPSETNRRLGLLEDRYETFWRIEGGRATDREGRTISLSPFLGWVGLMPGGEGPHSTTPPRRVGGNLDCRELTAGASLFLPVEVAGGLLSFGDGHGVQGDGEVSGVALECPMAQVELTVVLHKGAAPRLPWAQTPAGLLTLGFGERLDDAMIDALDGMVNRIAKALDVSREEAIALASLKADLRITQVVNEVKGVHALLSPTAMRELGLLNV
jgi:acetamidase/formamidase